MAGRDAVRYYNAVTAGLRARHIHSYEGPLVLEVSGALKSCHAGWPGGHCLWVPKEQEGLFHEEGNP